MEAIHPDALQRVEHIVVLQLENRSFDHMLGYLALPGNGLPEHPDGLGHAVDGLNGATNSYNGTTFTREPLDESTFDIHRLDPPHDAASVVHQIAGGEMSGFVEAWAGKLAGKRNWLARLFRRHDVKAEDLKAVMGYMTPDMVPVYDHLARHFCVCDRWFCGVAGPTMPNRFFSVAGEHGGHMDNLQLLFRDHGKYQSLFQFLKQQDMWRWYSSDPAILRAIDGRYRFDTDAAYDHFAYLDKYTEVQPRTFLSDVHDGHLPHVAWIDPNFAIADMFPGGGLLDAAGSNDDHPPSRVIAAQKLVNKVYTTLGRSDAWDTTMFVIFYDEHGGFHDHVPPPGTNGPRVPALVLGGRVKRGVCSVTFDHASLIKTILLRFGEQNALTKMRAPAHAAVAAANDLSPLLRDDDEVAPFVPLVPVAGSLADVTDEELAPRPMGNDASTLNHAFDFLDRSLSDLQALIVKHHALPLRSGREKLSRVPTKRLKKAVLNVAPDKPPGERLPDRRP